MHFQKILIVWVSSAFLCWGASGEDTGADRKIHYVDTNGNDATALPGRVDKPYRTIHAAKTNSNGGLVYVLPGHYTNDTFLASKTIDYLMLPGVTIDCLGKDLPNLIDDALYPGGINLNIDGFADFANHSTFSDNTKYPGLILVTNPLSRLDIRCRDMRLSYSTNGSINILNCSNVNINAQRMVGEGNTTGVYWRDGSGIHITARELRTASYAIWEDSPETNTVQDMFADVDYIEAGGEGGLYVSGKNPNSALWIKSKLMTFHGVTGLHLVGVSKFYASSQKYWLTSTTGVGALFYVGNTGRFWVDGNKATSAGAPFLVTARGFADLTIQQYEESVGSIVRIGFDLEAATVFVHGGHMSVRGTCVRNISGTNLLANMLLDSSRGTDSPVFIVGPGLTLQNCKLVAAPGVASITATNAQTVTIIGTLTVNTTPSTNVTFVGGRLIIDNSVSSTGPTPIIKAGPGAGTSPSISIVGNDVAGEITIKTGKAPGAGAVIATITYNSSPFVWDSYPVLSPANPAAGDLPCRPFADGTTTNFSVNAPAGAGLSPATTYKYNYQVVGR